MAERRQKRDVQLEFAFDRLVAVKLEQVYEILVADPGFRGDEAMLGGCATRGCVEMTRR
jgi:hypothetical protein